MLYLWIKSLHVVSVISWMAGMLYLPRLFVYHAMESEAVVRSRLEIMERRLLRAIINPAMVATLGTGIWMLVTVPYLMMQPWMHVKLACVLLLTGLHAMFARWRKKLIATPQFKSHAFFRVINEIPTVLMIIIVIMVIRRPFVR